MKKITLLLILLTVSLGYSQTVIEDFEGTAPTIVGTNGTSVSISSTQAMDANSLEIISASTGDPWQQAELTFQGDWLDLTTSKDVVVDVYSTTAFNVFAKVVLPAGAGPESATSTPHTGSGWETITLTFNQNLDNTGTANDSYGGIFFYYNWVGNNAGTQGANNNWQAAADGTFYVDNIEGMSVPKPETCSDGIMNQDETGVDCGGVCSACPSPPSVAAPTPPNRAAADVISFFSDAYTDITVDTFDTSWCPNVTTEVMIAGNATKLMTGAVCEGVDWQSSRPIDASGFTHFHMDIFTDEVDMVGKVFNSKFSQWGGGAGEVSALTLDLNTGTSPAIASGTWVSIDVEIATAFGGTLTRDDIVQFVMTTNLSNVWYDNLYLHKNTVLSTDDFSKAPFKAYPNPTQDKWLLSGNSQIESVRVLDILGKEVMTLSPNNDEATIDGSGLKSGIYFAQIKTLTGIDSIKLIKQ